MRMRLVRVEDKDLVECAKKVVHLSEEIVHSYCVRQEIFSTSDYEP
jgi:hypothetical protein